MGEIMAQVMERKVSNLVPLIFVCSLFEGTEPMMNTSFRQSLVSLRGEDIGTVWIASAMLKIFKEWTPSLIKQVDIAEFAALVSHMEPANLWPHMRMLLQQIGNVAHTPSCPVAQSENRFPSKIPCLLN